MQAEHKSHVLTFWRRGPKGRKMGAKSGCFVTGTMNSHFFVTGQTGMKFGQKTSIGVLY